MPNARQKNVFPFKCLNLLIKNSEIPFNELNMASYSFTSMLIAHSTANDQCQGSALCVLAFQKESYSSIKNEPNVVGKLTNIFRGNTAKATE